MARPATKEYDPKNAERIEAIKRLAHCETDTALAKKFGIKQPQISKLKTEGMSSSYAMIIDFLLDQLKTSNSC